MSRRRVLHVRAVTIAAVLCALCAIFAAILPANAFDTPSKPKVRTITAFVRLGRAHYQDQIQEALTFLRQAKAAYEKAGFEVTTIRITTQPFPEYTNGMTHDEVIRFFKNLDGIAQQDKITIAIGPAYIGGDDGDAQAALLADILQNSK